MRLQIALRLAIVAAAALGMTSLASAATWQNPTDADDVDNSGVIAPRDALIDVNRLNLVGIGAVPSSGSPPPYYDVTGDDLVTPADALHVFNRLAANAGSAAPAGAAVPSEPGDPQVAIELVVTDSGGTPVSIASPGQALLLEVFAEDLRVSPPFAGVFSASTDIAATDVSLLAGSAVYEPNWFADSPATYAPRRSPSSMRRPPRFHQADRRPSCCSISHFSPAVPAWPRLRPARPARRNCTTFCFTATTIRFRSSRSCSARRR